MSKWESVAALCAVEFVLGDVASRVPQLQINLFVDSNVALCTLMRGSSRQVDLNALVSGIWFEVAFCGTLLHGFRVPSKLNVADIPTRPLDRATDMRSLEVAGFREVEWHWPYDCPWWS